MYLSTYELQGTGEQAEELVKFKAFFLENDYDLPKENAGLYSSTS